ncbi:MAG: hypothetical protein Q7S01_06335 [bacterium]|nr:hypothetical protein [bacterium]
MDEFNKVNEANTSATSQPVAPQVAVSRSGAGSIVGAIIIIILLAIGAFYFWGAQLNNVDNNPPPLILGNETSESESDATAGLPAQQTSDETAAINADIQAMNIDRLNEAQVASAGAL